MKRITNLICLPGILLVCCVGILAALCGWERLDKWCQSKL